MTKIDRYFLSKKIAHMRHSMTRYDRHYDLMFDENGKQTQLRRDINRILCKIARGELDASWYGSIKNMIANERIRQKKEKQKNKKSTCANETNRL